MMLIYTIEKKTISRLRRLSFLKTFLVWTIYIWGRQFQIRWQVQKVLQISIWLVSVDNGNICFQIDTILKFIETYAEYQKNNNAFEIDRKNANLKKKKKNTHTV